MIYKPEKQRNESFQEYQERRRSMKIKLQRHKAGEMIYPVTEIVNEQVKISEGKAMTVRKKVTLNRSFVGDVRQTFKLK